MTTTHAQLLDAHIGASTGSARMASFLARISEMSAPVTDEEATKAIAAAVVRPNYDELDPGIRDTVRLLNDAGYFTTDSGDGRSKPREWYDDGDAIPFPHVVVASCPHGLVRDAQALTTLLGAEWNVEGTFVPASGSAYVFVSRPLPVEI